MSQPDRRSLGRLVAVHPISPAQLQRAVILAVLSFIFFITMMFAFYLLQNSIYFLLATAFLAIYLVTMYSFITGKRKTVEVFENGLRMGKTSALWPDVLGADDEGIIDIGSDKKLEIPRSIYERDALIALIRSKIK